MEHSRHLDSWVTELHYLVPLCCLKANTLSTYLCPLFLFFLLQQQTPDHLLHRSNHVPSTHQESPQFNYSSSSLFTHQPSTTTKNPHPPSQNPDYFHYTVQHYSTQPLTNYVLLLTWSQHLLYFHWCIHEERNHWCPHSLVHHSFPRFTALVILDYLD